MIVTAVFIGKDNSMGFRTGREYQIKILKRVHNNVVIRYQNNIIPYSNIITFLKNWTEINSLKY